MSVTDQIRIAAQNAFRELFQADIPAAEIQINATKEEFEGDYTLVLFPFIKLLKKSPETIGNEIGSRMLRENPGLIGSFNLVRGFLNLSVCDSYWTGFLNTHYQNPGFGLQPGNGRKVMVEYSSPNTNKPLHLGHLRNNFLGWSTAEILKANGYEVIKTCIVNDRGIHICKSMIAWQLFAAGATPESTGIKGDHFVGDYYVKFNDAYKMEVESLVAGGMQKETAEKEAPIMKAAQQMLVDWEAGNPEVLALWKKMNSWVYAGFDQTYRRIGSDFDRIYYESETYLLGKDIVEEGLAKKVFFKKADGGVWIDLTGDGLDEKIVRRKDGTSLYITQDIGLILDKYKEYGCEKSIYVVGDEQNYHFRVLKLIAQKLALPSAEGIYHLNYGMVELTTGKMKSREGTVVDADDLIAEMVDISREKTEELGKVKDFSTGELKELYDILGLGALKFYLLRVDPKKRMIFNPQESIDFQGFTGPFIQYTHARIKSILRKLGTQPAENPAYSEALLPLERSLLLNLEQFPGVIEEAGQLFDPSKIAIYIYNLARTFNSFYSGHSVTNAETAEKKILRTRLAEMTARTIRTAMHLLGIQVPERM